MPRVFISYHHAEDQYYKNALSDWAVRNGIFSDWSVTLGDISEKLSSQAIRRIIRDDYLKSSTVTVLLVGAETKYRKHVDWELKSSMIDGIYNKRSGIVVVMLPSADRGFVKTPDWREKNALYPHINGWERIVTRGEYERRFPNLPDRIIDNLIKDESLISVTTWNHICENPDGFRLLINNAYEKRAGKQYCLKRPMRRSNHNPLREAGLFGFAYAYNALATDRA